MQFTPADSTIAFELEERRIFEEMEREMSKSSPVGDDTLLDGSLMENTGIESMNDTALLDQVRIRNKQKAP